MSYFRKASIYKKGRWQYEPSFIASACTNLDPSSSTMIDMGAGTGLLSKPLERLGYFVEAIEPSFSMRRQWRKEMNASSSRIWRGDSLHIPHKLQVVLRRQALPVTMFVGNAFHWMSKPEVLTYWASIEMIRKICLVWQVLDESDPWVKTYFSVIQYFDHQVPRFQTHQWRHCFQRSQWFRMPKKLALPKNGVVERKFLKADLLNFAMSMSYVQKMSQNHRKHFSNNTKKFLDSTIKKNNIWLPLKTSIFVSTKK